MTVPSAPAASPLRTRTARLVQGYRDRWSDESELTHAVQGTVVGAAVMVAASLHGTLWDVVVGVIATLLVYWAVDRYAEALAAGAQGPAPAHGRILAALRRGWPMLQASYAPLLALIVTTALGASLQTGVLVALGLSTVLLVALGHRAARRAGASRIMALGWAAASGLLGVAVIALKLALH